MSSSYKDTGHIELKAYSYSSMTLINYIWNNSISKKDYIPGHLRLEL